MNPAKLFSLFAATGLLAGCATTPRQQAPVAEPPPVQLSPLPDYGTEQTGYDTSAGCVVYGMYKVENGITAGYQSAMNQALVQRGYPVIQSTGMGTSELRAVAKKFIRLDVYSCRHQYLPTDGRTAADIALVVGVFDRPDALLESNLNVRYFHVMGRDIAEGFVLPIEGVTTEAAIQKAVDNLFCIDAFRKALESAPEQAVANR